MDTSTSEKSDLLYELNAAPDLRTFCRALQKGIAYHTVVIVGSERVSGCEDFTEEVAAEICKLGTKISLHDKGKSSYIAAIRNGERVFEQLEREKLVALDFKQEEMRITAVSRCEGLSAPKNELWSWIEIDGNRYTADVGISFWVWDNWRNGIVAYATFDTSKTMKVNESGVAYNFAAEYFRRTHPEVPFITYTKPIFWLDPKEDKSDSEIIQQYKCRRLEELNRELGEGNVYHQFIAEALDADWFPLHQYLDTTEGILEITTPSKAYCSTNGVRKLYDYIGTYVTIASGHRSTTDQPSDTVRKLFTCGGCATFGTGARDRGTIASCLQRILNGKHLPILVENYGFFLWNTNAFVELVAILENLPYHDGDIIVQEVTLTTLIDADVDLSKLSRRPHDYGELFWDGDHLTEAGYALIAEKLFESSCFQERINFALGSNSMSRASSKETNKKHIADLQTDRSSLDYGMSKEQLERLREFQKGLRDFYGSVGGKATKPVVGSIAMNGNPFTLGHRYLIEEAAKQVDLLMVFVVQEDKSAFSFADRFALVERGTADLSNVAVVPSGEFMISTLTFSEYFNKQELQDRAVDVSLDVTLFAREITPHLNISVRFAGSEPFDRVTAQYNRELSVVLPKYGIRFEELPRMETGGEPISASRVRKLLEEGNFEEIRKLVPDVTYEYLQGKFLKN
ncbi:hypothetical protein FACS1894111_03890 [Clostridia bacterium]|nr:hypothetical protein FACS1894111_03890 [Clostridia bacterium]